jgi:hypothetical protein
MLAHARLTGNLTRSNNKGYVSFKYGFFNVFGVSFTGTKSFCLFFKVPKETAERTRVDGYDMQRYESQWNQVLYKAESGVIDLKKFESLFVAAYKNIVGEK